MRPFLEQVKDFLSGEETHLTQELLDFADNLTDAEILALAMQIQIKDSIDYIADVLKERLEEIRDSIDGK